MVVKEIEVKDIMTKTNLPVSDFAVNPYVGCTHACKYCYASFMKRFTRRGAAGRAGISDDSRRHRPRDRLVRVGQRRLQSDPGKGRDETYRDRRGWT